MQVAEGSTFLSPVTETAEIQRMVNSHNIALKSPPSNVSRSTSGRLRIKRTIFYTGYILSNTDSTRLIDSIVTPMLPPGSVESGDIRLMANNILITPRPAPQSVLDKVGGIGKAVKWRVTGTAVYENKIWAARVAPIRDREIIFTENPEPVMVLALRRGARPADVSRIQNWHRTAQENSLVFDSTVGQKTVLRVEEERPEEGEWESLFSNKSNKRKQLSDNREDDGPPVYNRSNRDVPRGYPSGPEYTPHGRSGQPYHRHAGDSGRFHHDEGHRRHGPPPSYRGSRGRGGRGRGPSGRGGGRGRGRGGPRDSGPSSYRSLDDYTGRPGGYDGSHDERGHGPVMNY